MNIRITSEDARASDFVFRTADRMRIDGCVNALAHEAMSLALYCEQEALLDHYLSMLLAQLRQQAPEHRIEVYFPTNTDALLGRFNDVLAAQSVKQATQSPPSTGQAHIWIVHDAHRLPESEVQLLARLIQNFPGAQIRAILLMSGTHSATWPLSAFGRKILRWDIEVPSLEQAQSALELAQHEGRSGPIVQLLQRMDHPACADKLEVQDTPDTATPLPSKANRFAAALQQQVHVFHQRGQAALQFGQGTQTLRARLRPRLGLALGLLAALALSTMLMLWLQPEAFGLKTGQPSATTNSLPPPAAGLANTSKPPLVQDNAMPDPVPAAQLAAKESTASSSPTTGMSPRIEAPEAAERAQTWVQGMDPQSFLLQYGTASTYAKALEIQRRFAPLQNSRIVADYRPGEKLAQFVIVAGPFAQVNDAYVASRQPNIPNGTWVRSTRSLQSQLQINPAAQETTR